MADVIGSLWQTLGDTLVRIAEGSLVFLAVWLVARLLSNLAIRAMARRHIRTDAALLLSRGIFGVLIGLGVFMWLSLALGQALFGLTGFLLAAVLTSLGLQDLFKNYVSGFYVLMEKNVRVGDLVETGGYRGVVTDVRMRVTYLRGAHGDMIVVPNSELFTKTLVVSVAPPNWGSDPEGAQDDSDKSVEVVAH
jgi:small conductance mechanosensitive channel